MSSRFANSLRAGCEQAVSKPLWHIPLLRVQWKTPDDGQRNCPKHAEFYSKNKFEKLVHLVGFIIRIYHDARSPERQDKKIIPQSGPEPWSSRQKSISIMTQLSRQMLRTFHRSRHDSRINLGLPIRPSFPGCPPFGHKFPLGQDFFFL